MLINIDAIQKTYEKLQTGVKKARSVLNKPLTLAEKILYGHLYYPDKLIAFEKGKDYVNFLPDRVAMQDATAQMALLQFMTAGRSMTAVPATVHCDHLILAQEG